MITVYTHYSNEYIVSITSNGTIKQRRFSRQWTFRPIKTRKPSLEVHRPP